MSAVYPLIKRAVLMGHQENSRICFGSLSLSKGTTSPHRLATGNCTEWAVRTSSWPKAQVRGTSENLKGILDDVSKKGTCLHPIAGLSRFVEHGDHYDLGILDGSKPSEKEHPGRFPSLIRFLLADCPGHGSSPTTFTPRASVCKFASGPAVSRKASIMSKASSLQ